MRDAVAAHLMEVNRRLADRDAEHLLALFEPEAVLIGSAGRAEDIGAYLQQVVDQGVLQWHLDDDLLTVDASGAGAEVVWFAAGGWATLDDERIDGFRLTGVLRRNPADAGWRFAQFHGSVADTGD